MNDLKALLNKHANQTVFRTADIADLLGRPVSKAVNFYIHHYIKTGQLIRLSKGLYTFTPDYNREELGNKFRVPSYVSFTTVLVEAGLIFQPYPTITLAAARSEKKEIAGQKFIYRKLKDESLLNAEGLVAEKGVMKATPERALLDWWYLDGEQTVDRPEDLDWEKMKDLNQDVYKSRRLASYIKKGA